jgi:hypothetical protein
MFKALYLPLLKLLSKQCFLHYFKSNALQIISFWLCVCVSADGIWSRGGRGMGPSLCVRVGMELENWKHNEDSLYTSSIFIAVHSTEYTLNGEN